MRVLLRAETPTMKQRMPHTLEFGHEFKTTYKKHGAGGPIKDIFYNKNIKAFVSYNEKQIHVWKEQNGQQLN